MKSLLSRRLRLENLESRLVLSGTVAAVVQDGSLIVTGDAENNRLAIYAGTNPGEVFVAGATDTGDAAGNTLVNGSLDPVLLTGFAGDISLALGDGHDKVLITNLTTSGAVDFQGGAQHDVLVLRGTVPARPDVNLNNSGLIPYGPIDIGGSLVARADALVFANASVQGFLTYLGDGGTDRFIANGSRALNSVGRSVNVLPGTGDDIVNVARLRVEGDLNVTDPLADSLTRVLLTNVAVSGNVELSLSNVRDEVRLIGEAGLDNRLQAGDVAISTGVGNDLVQILRADVANLALDMGDGFDRAFLNFATVGDAALIQTGLGGAQVQLRTTAVPHLRIVSTANVGNVGILLFNTVAIDAALETGDAFDGIDLQDSSFYNLDVATNAGNDTIRLTNNRVSNRFVLDGGAGIDQVLDGGENEFRLFNETSIEEHGTL